MAKYRARLCPNCNYYVGFSIAKPRFKTTEVFVTSFCLNCSYKLPIESIVHGVRRVASPLRRGTLRLAKIAKRGEVPLLFDRQAPQEHAEKSLAPANYGRHLRAIAQDIEHLRVRSFNLECTEESYLVWSRPGATNLETSSLSRLSKNRLEKLWKNKTEIRTQAQEEYFSQPSSGFSKRFRYSLREIDRIEREGQGRRRLKSGITDGHSLSQLLRTLGQVVGERGDRLLGISWQELSVSIVFQNAQGRREIDVFRPDNLYDLWVKMYSRRGNRVLSDIPR